MPDDIMFIHNQFNKYECDFVSYSLSHETFYSSEAAQSNTADG